MLNLHEVRDKITALVFDVGQMQKKIWAKKICLLTKNLPESIW